MPLTSIRLQNFRSYTDISYDLAPGVNIVVGPNASGKTNLLEAVLVLARGGSYRGKPAELVSFGSEWSRVDIRDADSGVRTLKLQCSAGAGQAAPVCKKSFEVDGKSYSRLSQQKTLPVVLFEPEHLRMLSGSPELRRSYLDDLLEQTIPSFGTVLRQYKRELAQRNALLKQLQANPRSDRSQMFAWNVRLSQHAGVIVRHRLALIERINGIAPDIYASLSGSSKSKLAIDYSSNVGVVHYESALLKRYEDALERDVVIGFTTSGPHRDDALVYLNDRPAQETASRGENRTIVLTLKVIEMQLIEAARDQPPILLLDDVFSELDGKRRQMLTEYLNAYQTLLTTTDADVAERHFADKGNIIRTG